jgi:carboxypeptidase C (cathepsin A)
VKIRKADSGRLRFVTDHSITLRGETVPYRVTAEECIFEDEGGNALGSFFTYTYSRTDIADTGKRPVIFAYNGGPGSSSVWLHLGLFGARRVKMSDPVDPEPVPPYELEDNPHCLLDICDLVMIDPVNTGYARLMKDDAASQFYGTKQDAKCTALIIEDWACRHNRHNSPRYLAGESYGTIRSCLLLRELMGGPFAEEHRLIALPVSGVILLGTSITMPVFNNVPQVYPDVLKLTARAAVHRYHHPEGKPELKDFIEQAWQFAGGEYLAGLFAGEGLTPGGRAELCSKLQYFTGVPAEWYDNHDLSISDEMFRSMVLRDRKLDVGAYDGRYTMAHTEQVRTADPVADDPAMGKYTPAFMGAMNSALKAELGITIDREYRAIDFMVNGMWDYSCPVSPTEALTAAMRRNEKLRVFFGSGIYDLVTYPGMVRYLVNHLDLPKDRVTVREYESGHMPYLGEESAVALEADLREFIGGSL